MNSCPACGRPKLKGVALDHEHNRIAVDGKIILLSPQETDLMSVFVKDPAFTFTTPELADKVWGSRWPSDIYSSVSGLIAKLRRKLEATNLRIVNVNKHGYGLRQNVGGRA